MKTILYLQSPNVTNCSRLKITGAQQRLLPAGFNLRRVAVERCTRSELKSLLEFWDAQGLIVDCRGHRPPISGSGLPDLPVVYLDMARKFESPQRLSITYDIRATCHLAAQELLTLECAAYGYAGYGPGVPWSAERRRIFEKALRLNGHETRTFDLDPSGVRPSTFYSRLSAWLQNLPKPCGVLAADDAYALHVHSAAQNLGLRIPADVAILGVDDESSSLATPGISSIRLDFQEAGRLAAELLLEKLAHPGSSPTSRHFGPVQVLRRGSTRKLRQTRGDFTDILERIRKEATAGVSAAEVASWLPGSRRLAEIRFREATGHSILEEIAAARIDRAKVLLVSTDSPIGEIADRCGYRTANAFRDAFKSVTGMAPREWRTRPAPN